MIYTVHTVYTVGGNAGEAHVLGYTCKVLKVIIIWHLHSLSADTLNMFCFVFVFLKKVNSSVRTILYTF